MLVVLAILSLCMAVAGPSLRNALGARSIDNSVAELAGLLREARAAAMLNGADASVHLDLESRLVSASWGARTLALPPNTTIEVLSAREELVTAATPSFRFFPDGSATGGTIRMRTPTLARTIAIDWLTGRVERDAVDR
jgi:general secretion pathway protein H